MPATEPHNSSTHLPATCHSPQHPERVRKLIEADMFHRPTTLGMLLFSPGCAINMRFEPEGRLGFIIAMRGEQR